MSGSIFGAESEWCHGPERVAWVPCRLGMTASSRTSLETLLAAFCSKNAVRHGVGCVDCRAEVRLSAESTAQPRRPDRFQRAFFAAADGQVAQFTKEAGIRLLTLRCRAPASRGRVDTGKAEAGRQRPGATEYICPRGAW